MAAALRAHGFEEEECALALDARGGVAHEALLLLLRLLAPSNDAARDALTASEETEYFRVTTRAAEAALQRYTAPAPPSEQPEEDAEAALLEERQALEAIFDDGFVVAEEAAGARVLRLHLPTLPVPGDLELHLPAGCRYPLEPALPLFVPAADSGAELGPEARVALLRALSEQAHALAADQVPARPSPLGAGCGVLCVVCARAA